MAGKTVEEATEQALDQLGVAVGDAEVIVVSEPKTGLFGRVRVEARVRARVRPVGPRPRRERSRRSGGKSGQGSRPEGQGTRQGGQRATSSEGGGGREREHQGRLHRIRSDDRRRDRDEPVRPAPPESQQGDDHQRGRRGRFEERFGGPDRRDGSATGH